MDKFNVPLAKNILISKKDEIKGKVENFPFPAIVKSQIAIGSRKKSGLIKIAQNKDECISLCNEFFSKEDGRLRIEAILIEELVKIQHEYYCSISLDALRRQFYFITSKRGGIDIEEVAAKHPEAIIKESFTLKEGLTEEMAKKAAKKLRFLGKNLDDAKDIFVKLWKITTSHEALLVEINPLVLTPSGILAVDAKIILDENSAFRQPLIKKLQERKLTDLEKRAKKIGFSFVELDGDIGILANGAGLTMAILDVLSQLGLKPSNFLDVGGGANKERVYEALKLLFKLDPKCVFINIYGGITRCDIVAEGIIQALKEFTDAPPMVIRLTGTNELEGIALLKNVGINAFKNVIEAVEKVKEVLS